MDVKKYAEKKELGLAEVVKAGGGYALAFKKWDPDAGKQVEPEIQAVNLAALAEQKKDLQSQVTDIETLEADIAALK